MSLSSLTGLESMATHSTVHNEERAEINLKASLDGAETLTNKTLTSPIISSPTLTGTTNIGSSSTTLSEVATGVAQVGGGLVTTGTLTSGADIKIYNSTGKILFADAGVVDTNLYRESANTLKTDDFFVSGGLATTADTMRVVTSKSPGATDAGDAGQIAWDANYMYVCTATNTWKKVPISTTGQSGTAYWTTMPGNPTRVSDTQFTITDTSNANKYDLLFKKGVIFVWDEGGTFQTAMSISSSYATNTVTINTVGDSLTAGFTGMKYAMVKASKEVFIIPGTLPSAATTNISKTWFPECDIYILSADLNLGTAGASTGSTVVDINDDGTTKFTTKPTITTTGTSDLDNVADNPSTAVAAQSAITVDVDSVTATAPADAYISVYYYPVDLRYRT